MSDTWVVDANGYWNVGTNWNTNPSYPNAPGADATFTGSYTPDPLTVTLSAGAANITVGNGIELAGGFQALVAEDVVVGFAGGYSKDQVHFDQYATGRNLNSFG